MAQAITDKKPSKHSGVPMSEENYKEWQKAFSDIEDCISGLYKVKKKAYNKKK